MSLLSNWWLTSRPIFNNDQKKNCQKMSAKHMMVVVIIELRCCLSLLWFVAKLPFVFLIYGSIIVHRVGGKYIHWSTKYYSVTRDSRSRSCLSNKTCCILKKQPRRENKAKCRMWCVKWLASADIASIFVILVIYE